MLNKMYGADPEVLLDPVSGLYYCYATKHDHKDHIGIYESKDLINWSFCGFAVNEDDPDSWCLDWFWAPECYYNPNNRYYYLFFSARTKKALNEAYFENKDYLETCRIAVMVSKSPKGPFRFISNKPMEYHPYDPDYINVDRKYDDIFLPNGDYSDYKSSPKGEYLSTIDINLFFDDDKRIYLYFSRCCYHNAIWDEQYHRFVEESNICCVELETAWWYSKEPIMPTIKKEYVGFGDNGHRRDKFVNIITYHNDPQDWENGHINDYVNSNGKKHNRRWSEGSSTFTLQINNKKVYALTYSGNNFENKYYGVGIAFASSPLGPFTKYKNNPIISMNDTDSFCSLGHGCPIYKNNELFYVHHGRSNEQEDRFIFATPLNIKNKDEISIGEIRPTNLILDK